VPIIDGVFRVITGVPYNSRIVYFRINSLDSADAVATALTAAMGPIGFNVPDPRGYFLRFTDMGAGRDPDAATRIARGDGAAGDVVGTTQDDEFISHTHTYGFDFKAVDSDAGSDDVPNDDAYYINASSSTGGNETRSHNRGVRAIIKT
jgi:hypothetical protein